MGKEVQFKAVSAFIFFAGVLFGYNDASTQLPNMLSQDGYYPTFEEHPYRPAFMPSYRGPYGISNIEDGAGHSHETNVVYTVGDINGVPYFTKVTTYDVTDSVPSYGRYPEFALNHAEMSQSPYHARNPAVIYFTKNPAAPCAPKKSSKAPGDGLSRFRTEDESELSEETEQVAPRILLRHLFPSERKSKRFHFGRRPKGAEVDPESRRSSRLAKMYKYWYGLHGSSNDKSRVHHNKGIKPVKFKPQHTSTESETDPPHVPPSMIPPPEDNGQPHNNEFARAYMGQHAPSFSSEPSPELTHSHQHSYPDDPDNASIHFPSGPYFPDEDLPTTHSHYSPSYYYAEDEQPPPYIEYFLPSSHPEHRPSPYYPEYFPPTHFAEDLPPPLYPQYVASPYHPEELPPPVYTPSSYFPEDQPPPPLPPAPHFPEDQPPPVHAQNSARSRFPQNQPPLSFRQYPPWPYFSGQTEYRSLPQQSSPLSFYSDKMGFPFFTPIPFPADNQGLPFFPPMPPMPPMPYFPNMPEPSPFPQPQTPAFYAGALGSGNFPTAILYTTTTTTSRPSSHKRNSKSRITVHTTSPATEILADGTKLPCGTTKKSRNPSDKSKTSKHCFGTPDNKLIVLTAEEDDPPSEDEETETRPRFSVFNILKKVVKLIFHHLITPPYSDD